MVRVNVLESKINTREGIVENKKCYVVQGCVNYESYPLAVFTDRESAQEYAEKATRGEYDSAEVIKVSFDEKSKFKKLGDR